MLGPFLFSVFLNDLPDVTTMNATLFTDDVCFSLGHKCANTLESLVNVELTKLSAWFQSNRLCLNVGKTNFVLLHKKSKKVDIKLKLNGISLERKDRVKYLGVTIDERLNWKAHIESCTLKLGKCLWAVRKLRSYTTISSLKL